MVAAITPPTKMTTYTNVSVPVTGATASTPYVVTAVFPGGRTQKFYLTTDGSGNGSFTYVPQHEDKGMPTWTVLPVTPTSTATSNAGVVTSGN